jgi:hypothetical protein
MKKNDLFLIAGTLLYSYLFYEQEPGINFLLFSLLLTAFLLLNNPGLIKNKFWLGAATGTMLSGFCIAWHGSILAVIANIISLSALSGLSIFPQSSFIISLLFSAYSYVSSPVFMQMDELAKRRKRKEANPGSDKRLLKWMTLGVAPLAVGFTFLLLYRAANPVFDLYVSKINLDFISVPWLFFTLSGFCLLYGFLYHRRIAVIAGADARAGNDLFPFSEWNSAGVRKYLNLPLEYKSGIILFGLLNLLLLSVNLIDINFLYLGNSLPEGLTYSQFLHQGVWALIVSVILAAAIILFYFRGELNFQKNTALRILTYIWIAQNIFMVCSTAWRNALYIEHDDLTYKRIGVYFYLGLTVIGLLFTTIKVAQKKTNWYLFRANSWAFYAVLVFSCLINWPVLVAKYNISSAIKHHEPAYQAYLLDLSFHTLPYLAEYQRTVPADIHDITQLSTRVEAFREYDKTLGWQSWSYDRWQTAEALKTYTPSPAAIPIPNTENLTNPIKN